MASSPDHDPPGGGLSVSLPRPDNELPGGGSAPAEVTPANVKADFRADAEAAARANGFGPTAAVVHMEAMTAEPGSTNPGIVFEENRAAVAPGGNDYSVLREPPTLAAEQAGPSDTQQPPETQYKPQETMTRALTVGIAPEGMVLSEVSQDLRAHIAEAALQATGYAEPFRPGSEAQQEAAATEQPTEQEIHQREAVQQDLEASTKRQADELPGAENLAPASEGGSVADQFRAAYESIKAEKSALEEGNEQGNSQDQGGGNGAAAAFRSFGGR
jgi:hypothetical protein